jgi:hypothetical protein
MKPHDIARWRHALQTTTQLVPIRGTRGRFTLRVKIAGAWCHVTTNRQAADLVARHERGY